MFSKKNRAKTAAVLKAVADGKTKHTSHFSIRTVTNDSPVFAVIVSKKIATKAVTRNMLKRRIKTAIRPLAAHAKNATFLIYAKKGVKNLTISEIQEELRESFS